MNLLGCHIRDLSRIILEGKIDILLSVLDLETGK
jgi:hypothetical protein